MGIVDDFLWIEPYTRQGRAIGYRTAASTQTEVAAIAFTAIASTTATASTTNV